MTNAPRNQPDTQARDETSPTRERVRQLAAGALRKLETALSDQT